MELEPRLNRYRKKPEPDPLTFSKTIVVLSFILLIIYTTAVLVIFAITGQEPVTMTQYFVNAIIGEFSLLGVVKVVKIVKSRNGE